MRLAVPALLCALALLACSSSKVATSHTDVVAAVDVAADVSADVAAADAIQPVAPWENSQIVAGIQPVVR